MGLVETTQDNIRRTGTLGEMGKVLLCSAVPVAAAVRVCLQLTALLWCVGFVFYIFVCQIVLGRTRVARTCWNFSRDFLFVVHRALIAVLALSRLLCL